MITNTNLIACMLIAICGIILPVILVAVWKKKTRQPMKPVLIGALTFFVFAIILESFPKLVLLQSNNSIGKVIVSNVYLYSMVGALLAGIFEETGRLVAYKVLLRKYKERMAALTYGIGHGGFEAMYILAGIGISYFAYGMMINAGQFDQIVAQVASAAPEQSEAVNAIPDAIAQITYPYVIASVIERVSAVMIHVACSIVMFKAAHEKGKLWLYPVAILIHASIDLIAAFYQVGLISNLYFVEVILFIWAVALLGGCYKFIYKKMPISY